MNKQYYEAKAEMLGTRQSIARRYLNVALIMLTLGVATLILMR
jgi:hypothetical protein